jgi:hypothetical protein
MQLDLPQGHHIEDQEGHPHVHHPI